MTINDIAKLAGVSTATVSRILNNKTGFSEKTRQHVLKIIEEQNFSLNAIASGLASKRTQSIGVILPYLSGFFISSILKGIEGAADDNDLSVIICNTEDKDIGKSFNILKKKQVDGILVVSSYIDIKFRALIENIGIPIVMVLSKSPYFSFPYVKVDDQQASYDAVKYLIEKGHRKIGMISGSPIDPIAGKPRIDGYMQALKDFGIPDDEKLISYGDFMNRSGFVAMSELLSKQLGITAVFSASDEMAAGAYKAILSRGLRIPEDLSIMGYDDTALADILHPGLTTIHQPIEELGRRSLVELISGKGQHSGLILSHSIKVRESVADITE